MLFRNIKSKMKQHKPNRLSKNRNTQSLPRIEQNKTEAVPVNIDIESARSNAQGSETELHSNASRPHKLSPIRRKPKSKSFFVNTSNLRVRRDLNSD